MWVALVLGAFVLGGFIGMLVLALLMFAARDADRSAGVPPISFPQPRGLISSSPPRG